MNVTYIRASEPKPKQSIPIEPLKETPKDDFSPKDDFDEKLDKPKKEIIEPPIQPKKIDEYPTGLYGDYLREIEEEARRKEAKENREYVPS